MASLNWEPPKDVQGISSGTGYNPAQQTGVGATKKPVASASAPAINWVPPQDVVNASAGTGYNTAQQTAAPTTNVGLPTGGLGATLGAQAGAMMGSAAPTTTAAPTPAASGTAKEEEAKSALGQKAETAMDRYRQTFEPALQALTDQTTDRSIIDKAVANADQRAMVVQGSIDREQARSAGRGRVMTRGEALERFAQTQGSLMKANSINQAATMQGQVREDASQRLMALEQQLAGQELEYEKHQESLALQREQLKNAQSKKKKGFGSMLGGLVGGAAGLLIPGVGPVAAGLFSAGGSALGGALFD